MTKYIIIISIIVSILGASTKLIYDTVESLKKEILDLKDSNKALVKKQDKIKTKLKDRRKALISNTPSSDIFRREFIFLILQ